jgi:hypothetical protein
MVAWMPTWVIFGLLVFPFTVTPAAEPELVELFDSCVEKSGPMPRKKCGAGTNMRGAKTPIEAELDPELIPPELPLAVA